MSSPDSREHIRRLRIRLAALRRHADARDPFTGKSALAVAAGQASGRQREGDRAWGLESALKRWHPKPGTATVANPVRSVATDSREGGEMSAIHNRHPP